MLNKYQDKYDLTEGLRNLPKGLLRAAFCRWYPTRINMPNFDNAAAVVNIKDYRFLRSVELMVKTLNSKMDGNLTVPEFIANALDNYPTINVDAKAVREQSRNWRFYNPRTSLEARGKLKKDNVIAAIERDTSSVIYATKNVSPVDLRRPRAAIVSFDDHVLLESVRDAFKNSADRGAILIHKDWEKFELKMAEIVLREFARVSEAAIPSLLIDQINPSDEYQHINNFHRRVGLRKVRNKDEFVPESLVA